MQSCNEQASSVHGLLHSSTRRKPWKGAAAVMLCRWDRLRELESGSHHCHGHDGNPHPAPHSRHRSTVIERNPKGTCMHAACLLTGVHLLSKPYPPSNCTKHQGFQKLHSRHTHPLTVPVELRELGKVSILSLTAQAGLVFRLVVQSCSHGLQQASWDTHL